ncbi:hypothetical protein HYH03_008499 [Edaphochlamys debaryana]|uniref:Uncharacterized protein n=1 Tax=Edaphochlamys debaryana TaxID=47281 RepID=A0A835XYE4_9CHLO|nr:hypothetical protein HYH03_008499 [Edaphochlamys debaryana]|eukprot:KAG2493367.1 hypothetical protein HYH03_008499 [Edaphochlamys debaryana]
MRRVRGAAESYKLAWGARGYMRPSADLPPASSRRSITAKQSGMSFSVDDLEISHGDDFEGPTEGDDLEVDFDLDDEEIAASLSIGGPGSAIMGGGGGGGGDGRPKTRYGATPEPAGRQGSGRRPAPAASDSSADLLDAIAALSSDGEGGGGGGGYGGGYGGYY